MNVEIEVLPLERTQQFLAVHEREALTTAWGFRIVPHEQHHAIAATRDGEVIGALALRVAASLAHIEALVVAPAERGRSLGRHMLARAEELANYYNCHKVTVEVPAGRPAQTFFERCGYKLEAVLPQHTWKLDVAIMRKFLL